MKLNKSGGRIISVGTTSTRTLETIASAVMENFKRQVVGQIFLFIRDMNLKRLME